MYILVKSQYSTSCNLKYTINVEDGLAECQKVSNDIDIMYCEHTVLVLNFFLYLYYTILRYIILYCTILYYSNVKCKYYYYYIKYIHIYIYIYIYKNINIITIEYNMLYLY